MKNIIKSIGLCFGLGLALQACDDWTIPENEVIQNLEGTPKSEEYYEKLRAYKKSDHQLAFGWFGGWNGGLGSTSMRGSLRSAPDSMDIISIWSKTYYNLDEARKADIKYVQEKLGTKVTYTVFSHNMANLFYDAPDRFENIAENIPAAAKALADSIFKYGYDGIDFDHECTFGNLFYDKDNMTTLLREMRKNLGPDKLILVDGNISLITEEGWSYANYAVSQAYGTSSPSTLESRYNGVKKYIGPERLIVTENFESYWENGGVTYTDEEGNKMPSLLGMATWKPKDGGRKGGVGAYHMEYEYKHDPEYKYMRQAIQIMNPANPNN